MKKINVLLWLLCLTLTFAAQGQKVDTVKIQTSAICEMCKYTIEKDMAFEKGVEFADLENKVLTVAYKPKKTDSDKIRTRITQIGYHADDLKRAQEAYDKLPLCCKDGAHADDEHEPHK